MVDKRYRSGALKRKPKNERQRREKEALSKLKTITGFFTPVTPQPDVPVLAERSVDNNLLEETAGADLISRSEQPISGLSSFLSEAMEAAKETATAPDRPTATTDSDTTDPVCWGKIDENVRAYWARKGPLA